MHFFLIAVLHSVMTLLTLLTFLFQLGDSYITDGYLKKVSVHPGDSVEVYFSASRPSSNHTVNLFDIQGNVKASFQMDIFPQESPKGKAYEDGFDYKKTATVKVPELPSGVYLWENVVPMVIKARNPKILIVYSINTENAYCSSGGKSLYDFNSDENKRATKVSFHRPIELPRHSSSFLRWIAEQHLENVGYITDLDMDDYSEIRRASLLIIPGHSEYWTYEARRNFDRFVNDGKNALVLSGNTMWWQVRYNRDRTQLICHKSADDDKVKNKKLRTTRWNDPTLGYPITKSIGVEFSLAGYGRKVDKGWDGFQIICESPLLENTGIKVGEVLHCLTDEYDGAPLLGFNDNKPVVNRFALGFEKMEIVGFDFATLGGADGVATWVVFKATRRSGIVINTASTDWCSEEGIGSNAQICQITVNMITKLLKKENVFSPTVGKEAMPAISH